MDAQLPGITEGFDLFRLTGGILGFALTTGFALGWLTFLGIVVGSTVTGALVLWTDYLLKQNP